jgi:hypothetical protein
LSRKEQPMIEMIVLSTGITAGLLALALFLLVEGQA